MSENFGVNIAVPQVTLKPVSQLKPKLETDPHRLEQRQKQITLGKITAGYKRYLRLVPKELRSRGEPATPNPHQVCSKRSWDGQLNKWRRQLHDYDPPEGEDAEAFKPEPTSCKIIYDKDELFAIRHAAGLDIVDRGRSELARASDDLPWTRFVSKGALSPTAVPAGRSEPTANRRQGSKTTQKGADEEPADDTLALVRAVEQALHFQSIGCACEEYNGGTTEGRELTAEQTSETLLEV